MSDERDLVNFPGKDYILEHLGCPICLQIPLPPIWMCARGHSVCNECRPQLQHCGICREFFPETRNFFMEAIVMESTFACPYKNKGCTETFVGHLLKEHKSNCAFGPKIKWISCTDGICPANAVDGGHQQGIKLYVIRAPHHGSITPGKMFATSPVQGVAKASLCWGGGEHRKSSYEVLVAPANSIKWVASSNGEILPNAILGGISEDGGNLYIGRARCGNNLIVGKIHPSHGCCYIPDGNEKRFTNYEILVEVVHN